MAIAHRDTQTAQSGSTPITLTKPTGTVANDFLIFGSGNEDGFHNSTTLNSPPSGFAAMTGSPKDAAADWNRIFADWKIAGGSEGASYDFGFSDAHNKSCLLSAYSGVDTATPFDVTPVPFISDGTVNCVAPTISPVTAGCMLLVIFGPQTSYWGIGGVAPPGSMNERVELSTPSFCAIYMADELLVGAGATGTRTFVLNDAQPMFGWTIVLRPTGGAAVPAGKAKHKPHALEDSTHDDGFVIPALLGPKAWF